MKNKKINIRPRILFLLKENYNYGQSAENGTKSGLYNSALMVAERLANRGYITSMKICVDGNSVDRAVSQFNPQVCILEAMWVTPEKMQELKKLHPTVRFYVRIHSETPFLAMEGIAIDWIRRLNVPVAFNSIDTCEDFTGIIDNAVYLPNIYEKVEHQPVRKNNPKSLDIACFGAIRPLKNQLQQALVAIIYANTQGLNLNFHINAPRIEQGGDPVIKNIRALFDGSRHRLIEHGWERRSDFLQSIYKMDLGLQVSFTESFNIVAADFVRQGVPIVVSPAIKWAAKRSKADPNSVNEIVAAIAKALDNPQGNLALNVIKLKRFNKEALKVWQEELG